MAKVTTTLTIDYEIYQQAKNKIKNISSFVESCLKEHLEIPDSDTLVPEDVLSLLKEEHKVKSALIELRSKLDDINKEKRKRGVVVIK